MKDDIILHGVKFEDIPNRSFIKILGSSLTMNVTVQKVGGKWCRRLDKFERKGLSASAYDKYVTEYQEYSECIEKNIIDAIKNKDYKSIKTAFYWD